MADINPSVTDFLANFQGGGARPNLYAVNMQFPSGVGGPAVARKAAFTCRSAALPASNLGIAVAPYMGRQVKLPGDRVFDDWTITVLSDTDYSVRNAFEIWSDMINGHVSNVAASGWSAPSRLFGSAEVTQIDREDNEIKTYIFEGIYPTNVAEVAVAWDQNDSIQEFSVTLAVNYWRSNTTT